jgi:hypothetical protein
LGSEDDAKRLMPKRQRAIDADVKQQSHALIDDDGLWKNLSESCYLQ